MGNKFSLRKAPAAEPTAGGTDDPEHWRQEARQHAQRRNEFYERSQKAYRENKGAEAKALSLQGKEEARLMEDANRKASDAAFRSNNAGAEADFIDLHGLYVREAEAVREVCGSQCRLACNSRLKKSLHVLPSGH